MWEGLEKPIVDLVINSVQFYSFTLVMSGILIIIGCAYVVKTGLSYLFSRLK